MARNGGCWRWFFCLHWKLKNLPHLVGIEKGSLTTFILKINRKLTKQDALNKKQPPLTPGKSEWRLQYQIFDALKYIKKNEVHVIDIAKLSEDKQAYVFGDAVRTIYNLQLGEYGFVG